MRLVLLKDWLIPCLLTRLSGTSSQVNNVKLIVVTNAILQGVSVGSINTMGISQFAPGDEKNMANWLIDLWYKIEKNDVYKPYIGGILTGLLYERGIYNTAPLKKTLQK